MYVTGRLVALVAAGVVPVVALSIAGVDPWWVVVGWLVLCALLAGVDAAAAVDPRLLRVSRSGPSRALLHEPVDVSLTVRREPSARAGTRLVAREAAPAASGRLLRGMLRDAWQPTAGAPTARRAFDLAPGEATTLTLTLHPRRRGELRSAFVAVRSRGPVGLAGRQAVLDVPGRIRVLPPFTSRRHLPSRLARLRELDGATSVLVRGQGSEFDSLRPYVRGDDVRSIDWRATARAGTTMLRTWRPERDRHVVVIVDTGRTSAVRVGDGTRLDAAMEAVLLLSALASAAGDHMHVLLFDRVVRARVTGVDGDALLPTLVDAMAPVEPLLRDTDWPGAFAAARAFAVRPSLTVLITAQDDPTAARGFLAALPAASAGTHVLVATATDTALEEMTAVRATSGEVYRAAAAEQTLADARRVGVAVERAGARSLVASPDDLPPKLADRYLALKAAGML